ncbi:MAG: ATP-dependent RecD-like DNA helicase, partial [Clostridiales bacterium]|nr:ATP-dependent RecD-like DNA helicase [Clostridiales bacterium]
MEDSITIEGSVENIIYQNEENGYTVFSIEVYLPDGTSGGEITCVATMPKISEGERLRLTGNYKVHPTYGRQFDTYSHQRAMPATTEGIEKYLASGIIKGVGKVTAKLIVEMFGENTIAVIEQTPEKLTAIKGISLKKASEIGKLFGEQAECRHVMMYLQALDITPGLSKKIYEKYKGETISVVSENPYILAAEIEGIGFKIADSIAAKMDLRENSPQRVKAGVRHILTESVADGHVFLPYETLVSQSVLLLNTECSVIDEAIIALIFDRVIHREKDAVYLNSYYYMESYCARKLLELNINAVDKSQTINEDIAAFEAGSGIKLAAEQKRAVKAALSEGVLVITGGPGTGKTTTINAVITLLSDEGLSIELAAPTGRAAKRITEATGAEARTIHRLLESNFSENNNQIFGKNEDAQIDADVIIIDESSMIDTVLLYHLLKAIPIGARLIFAGDADQLPSVGAGNILKDIIGSGVLPTVKLTKIFRQAQQSAIVMNAHRINKGESPHIHEKSNDFFFIKRFDTQSVAKEVTTLTASRLPQYCSCSPGEIQVLTPMRRGALGSVELNKILQERLNPPSPLKAEKIFAFSVFREGDKVMQIKNNYNLAWRTFFPDGRLKSDGTGIFNGDEGRISKIDDINETVTVNFFDDKVVFYDYSQLDEIELSYAITIHKSQGSEYKAVV